MKKLAVFALVLSSLLAFSEPISDATRQQVYQIGLTHGVPVSITRQLMQEESKGDAKAISNATPEGFVSRGLFQIYTRPADLKWLIAVYWKGRPETFDIEDPIDNAKLALAYLSALHRRFGNWYQALVYYNHGDVKDYSEDTRAYARRIINAK